MAHLFWTLNIIGIILLIAGVWSHLSPKESTRNGKRLKSSLRLWLHSCAFLSLCSGEPTPKHPIVPYHLLRDRGIWTGVIIAVFINFIWYMQEDYMFSVLIVAADQSVKAATRIASLYSFESVIVGTCWAS